MEFAGEEKDKEEDVGKREKKKIFLFFFGFLPSGDLKIRKLD